MAQKTELECLKKLPLKKIYAPKLVPKQENSENKDVSVNPKEESKGPDNVQPGKDSIDSNMKFSSKNNLRQEQYSN